MDEYLDWLYFDILNGPETSFKAYNSLFRALLGVPYRYTHPMDRNRFKDGLELREDYCRAKGEDLSDILEDCTVFEMFVALAFRMEKDIMAPMSGDFDCFRWFWGFIEALELDEFDENDYDFGWICKIIDQFLDRETYIFSGFEGDEGFGELQIWDQMNEFLDRDYI